MLKTILSLVETHAIVIDVAPVLVGRVLEALIDGITEMALDCFQRIPKYGTGGMLTVSIRCNQSSLLCRHPNEATLYDRRLTSRQRSRLNFCTNRSMPMSVPRQTTRSPRYTIQSRKRTGGKRARRTFIASWTV
jgi:hypothetical protein